jgi:hypothetical protein
MNRLVRPEVVRVKDGEGEVGVPVEGQVRTVAIFVDL